jgi:hypothetical protein
MVSSAMMVLLTKSRKVPSALSTRCSYSLVDSPFMKWYFFFLAVSTCFGAYCARQLDSLE